MTGGPDWRLVPHVGGLPIDWEDCSGEDDSFQVEHRNMSSEGVIENMKQELVMLLLKEEEEKRKRQLHVHFLALYQLANMPVRCNGKKLSICNMVALLSGIHYWNLVTFPGYSQQDKKNILVYEFMHNERSTLADVKFSLWNQQHTVVYTQTTALAQTLGDLHVVPPRQAMSDGSRENVAVEPSIFLDDDMQNVAHEEEDDGIDLNGTPGNDSDDSLQLNMNGVAPNHGNAGVASDNANGNAATLVDESDEDISSQPVVPFLGMVFDNVEEAQRVYNEYASKMGFGTRIVTSKHSRKNSSEHKRILTIEFLSAYTHGKILRRMLVVAFLTGLQQISVKMLI
uniref:Protein FAR1-RELATED SEQUENCE n=1 Tax=Aegilops tauschii TaxID=37682 RepID=N1QXL2_AEGTA